MRRADDGRNHNYAHSALINKILEIGVNRTDLLGWKHPTGYDPVNRVRYGLKGSSDTIWCRAIRITPEMVGRIFGLFVCIEGKTGQGEPEEDQLNFGSAITRCGGIYKVARCVEDAREVLG